MTNPRQESGRGELQVCQKKSFSRKQLLPCVFRRELRSPPFVRSRGRKFFASRSLRSRVAERPVHFRCEERTRNIRQVQRPNLQVLRNPEQIFDTVCSSYLSQGKFSTAQTSDPSLELFPFLLLPSKACSIIISTAPPHCPFGNQPMNIPRKPPPAAPPQAGWRSTPRPQ